MTPLKNAKPGAVDHRPGALFQACLKVGGLAGPVKENCGFLNSGDSRPSERVFSASRAASSLALSTARISEPIAPLITQPSTCPVRFSGAAFRLKRSSSVADQAHGIVALLGFDHRPDR
jgi:hypothetical protein